MRKVLVVEDEPEILWTVATSVRDLGYEVIEAVNGEEGLKKVDEADIVLLDWSMPVLNGIEFCKRVRARNSPAYIIMITAKTKQDNVYEGLIAGANDYMMKPFDLYDLELRLQFAVATIELNRVNSGVA